MEFGRTFCFLVTKIAAPRSGSGTGRGCNNNSRLSSFVLRRARANLTRDALWLLLFKGLGCVRADPRPTRRQFNPAQRQLLSQRGPLLAFYGLHLFLWRLFPYLALASFLSFRKRRLLRNIHIGSSGATPRSLYLIEWMGWMGGCLGGDG